MISIQDAIKKFYHVRGWDTKIAAAKIKDEWALIVGPTIAQHTESIRLVQKVLLIKCSVPILKHELMANRTQVMEKVNAHFKSRVVEEIRVV